MQNYEKLSYICIQNHNIMFKEYKVFDDGIWLPYHELKKCYCDSIEYLKTVKNYPNLASRTVGQIYFLEELIAKCENSRN